MSERLALAVLALPFWPKTEPKRSVLLILPGIQEYRIAEGVKYWPEKAQRLWVAGTRGDPFYTRREILEIIGRITAKEGDAYLENGGWANHTPDQMRWAVELLKKSSKVNHIAICTAVYHVPRCVLTLVRAMLVSGTKRVISILPTWHPEGPAVSGSKEWDEEMEKISRYQGEGDVATLQEWCAYSLWRASQ